MPPEDASHEVGHKFPFVSSEIFSAESQQIVDMFFTARADDQSCIIMKQTESNNEILRAENDSDEEVETGEPKVFSFSESKPEETGKNRYSSYEEGQDDEAELIADETIKVEGAITEDNQENMEIIVSEDQVELKDDYEHQEDHQEEEKKETMIIEETKETVNPIEYHEKSSLDSDEDKPADPEFVVDTLEAATESTEMTEQDHKKYNKHELLEQLLAFIDTKEEVNPVLAGYWCKTMQSLVGCKPTELFTYFYSHTEVFQNMVNHLYSRSICQVLIRMLNVSDNVFEDNFQTNYNEIRTSFVEKIVERLGPQFTCEDNQNAVSLLGELAEIKPLYTTMTSPKCLAVLKEIIDESSAGCGDSEESFRSVIQLLTMIVQRYKSNESFQKRIISSNLDDEEGLDDEEDTTIFKDDHESELFLFIQSILPVLAEQIPSTITQEYETQFQEGYLPFGMLRARIVELFAIVVQVFSKEVLLTLLEIGAVDSLLDSMEKHPFNNVLHFKLNEIVMAAFDSEDDKIIAHLLYSTSLLKKVIEISFEKSTIQCSDLGNQMNYGYIVYIRKFANKLDELSKTNDEVQSCLESMPEWQEFFETNISSINLIESKPLVDDPRNPTQNNDEDGLDFFVRLQNSNVLSIGGQQINTNDFNNNDEEDEEEDDWASNNNFITGQDIEDDDQKLDKNENNDDLQKYFSGNHNDYGDENDEVVEGGMFGDFQGPGLSLDDLTVTTRRSIVEEYKEPEVHEQEEPEFYNNNYWRRVEPQNVPSGKLFDQLLEELFADYA